MSAKQRLQWDHWLKITSDTSGNLNFSVQMICSILFTDIDIKYVASFFGENSKHVCSDLGGHLEQILSLHKQVELTSHFP